MYKNVHEINHKNAFFFDIITPELEVKRMVNWKGVRTCFETVDTKPNYSALGRFYNIDRRTAKKRYNGIENKLTRERHSVLDKYQNIIIEKCNIPGTNIKSVYKYIQMNIDNNIGTYSNFNKYIHKNKEIIFKSNKQAHVLFETNYGVQLQFDWKGPIKLHFKNGNIIEFYIFSTTLCASRFHTFIYSEFMTLESVERCLIETFKIIGGIPKECLTDNMASIINYSEKTFTKEFKAFAKDMGFIPKHCKVNSPETKGKDESCNRFMNWLLPYNYEFNTKDELLEIIKKLNKEINKEVNQTTNMPPIALFTKEKEYLQPLPNKTIIDQYLDSLIAVKVQNTMLFYYKGSRYSVPKKYINKTLKVKEIDNKLQVYYNKELIKIHDINDKKINYDYQDYVEGLSSSIYNKSQEEIDKLAKHNLELLNKITKKKEGK